ncbi:DUF1453 family protein [Streptacidiphilus albus]|uniref:DUF1453 family protein n=1 Tax=Streptacidiphilus albus TaxID=105425 RepID=UPI00054C1476|nr:DUF1453 family protein [Streptacidiphilus albus]
MFEIVLIIAAVCYVMFRRVAGEPAQAKRMLLLPAVLVALGLSDVSGAGHDPAALAFLIGTAAVSIALGALRGLSTRLSEQGGIAYVHYTAATVVLWLLSLAAKFGLNFVFQAADPHAAAAAGNSLLLTLGAGMLVEGAVTLNRAVGSTSRVLWSKGKDGRPHTTSPFLDELQSRRANR